VVIQLSSNFAAQVFSSVFVVAKIPSRVFIYNVFSSIDMQRVLNCRCPKSHRVQTLECSSSSSTETMTTQFSSKHSFLLRKLAGRNNFFNFKCNLLSSASLGQAILFSSESTLSGLLFSPGPWQCVLFLIPRSFYDGGAINYSTAPPS
jgi:hypothetical protein